LHEVSRHPLAVIFVLCRDLSILHPSSEPDDPRARFSSDKAHASIRSCTLALAVLALVWLRFQTATPAR